jgi:uncharacterized membrane protein
LIIAPAAEGQHVITLEFVALFFAGLLAGVEVAVRFGVREALTVLDQQPHIVLRQALIARLRVLVPAIYAPAFLTATAVTIAAGTGTGFVLRCAGLLALVVWTFTTFTATVPLNKALYGWRPEAPPQDWQSVIRRWERLDTIRTCAAVLAFACFLTSAALQLAAN